MLFNPKWNPLSLESLILWLEAQPPEKTYEYLDEKVCLAGQFNKSIGREYDCHHIRLGSFDSALEDIAAGKPRTYGAALMRARKQL